jgi:hypothetical protein
MNESGYAHTLQVTGASSATRVADTGSVSSLHLIAPARRRRMALILLPAAAVLLALGLTPALSAAGVGWIVLGAVLVVAGLLLAAVAAGLRRSAVQDERARSALAAESALDEVILASPELAAVGCGENCGSCGVEDCAVKALPRS